MPLTRIALMRYASLTPIQGFPPIDVGTALRHGHQKATEVSHSKTPTSVRADDTLQSDDPRLAVVRCRQATRASAPHNSPRLLQLPPAERVRDECEDSLPLPLRDPAR